MSNYPIKIEAYGWGDAMHVAQQEWEKSDPRACFVIGPCKVMTTPCFCRLPGPEREVVLDGREHCDWCCGCGWVTHRVHELQKRYARNRRRRGKR